MAIFFKILPPRYAQDAQDMGTVATTVEAAQAAFQGQTGYESAWGGGFLLLFLIFVGSLVHPKNRSSLTNFGCLLSADGELRGFGTLTRWVNTNTGETQCWHHGAPTPLITLGDPIETLDHQNIFSHGCAQIHACHIQPCLACQTHGNELCFDHTVEIIICGKFGNVLSLAIVEQRFRACFSEGGSVVFVNLFVAPSSSDQRSLPGPQCRAEESDCPFFGSLFWASKKGTAPQGAHPGKLAHQHTTNPLHRQANNQRQEQETTTPSGLNPL